MKAFIRTRLERLEAQLGTTGPNETDSNGYRYKFALMLLLSFHGGGWTMRDAPVTALARALNLTGRELKSAVNNNNEGPDFWLIVLEKLDALVATRGGRPLIENDSLSLERPSVGDEWRNGFDVLDELY
jgi:hypothetical protein